MTGQAEANDLVALTILVPRPAASLLAERAEKHGRPTEFEATLTMLMGMVAQCHQMDLDCLAVSLRRHARDYAVLAGYPEAVGLRTERV